MFGIAISVCYFVVDEMNKFIFENSVLIR